jgi:hypothetical protein
VLGSRVWAATPRSSAPTTLAAATWAVKAAGMTDSSPVRTTHHPATRLSIDVGQPYDAFRSRLEETIPPWPEERFEQLVRGGTNWEEVAATAAAIAPLGLFIFWRLEQTPLMRVAGDAWKCTSYLVGNTIVAQRMYHHDPAVMSAVPFHLTISVGPDDATRLTFDQPSTHLTSFGGPAFVAVATKVDAKVAELLELLDAPVPEELVAR